MSDDTPIDFIHKEFPKRFARDDFWAQIKRTVNGQPVSERDIDLIVAQINRHLQLTPLSHLLDLGCGNGALAARLFPGLARYTGVDFSAYLLGVAREYFCPHAAIDYIESDALAFVTSHERTCGIDKVLIYGCMSYFGRPKFAAIIDALRSRFPDLDTILVGNIPDRNRAAEFFASRHVATFELDNAQTPIGIWWTQEDLGELGARSGYSVEISRMPTDFYGHHYRFDATFRKIQPS